jgi:hypothetical protein
MKNPFCYINIHKWEYRKEKHKVKDHPNGREYVRVIVRECKCCGKRQHHMLPQTNGCFMKWSSFNDVKQNEVVEYKRVCK